jgi:hypothetical protein
MCPRKCELSIELMLEVYCKPFTTPTTFLAGYNGINGVKRAHLFDTHHERQMYHRQRGLGTYLFPEKFTK